MKGAFTTNRTTYTEGKITGFISVNTVSVQTAHQWLITNGLEVLDTILNMQISKKSKTFIKGKKYLAFNFKIRFKKFKLLNFVSLLVTSFELIILFKNYLLFIEV